MEENRNRLACGFDPDKELRKQGDSITGEGDRMIDALKMAENAEKLRGEEV